MTYTIYLRDANRNRIAQLDDFSELEMVLRYNAVSTWLLEVPAGGDASNLLAVGPPAGIIVERDGITILSGPVRQRERIWGLKTDRITIAGVDDTWWLGTRLALQTALGGGLYQEYDTRTDIAETVMRQFVDVNAGASASAARQVPGLSAGTSYSLGPTVTGRARFTNLLELMQYLGNLAGLGFRVAQSDTSLLFTVYAPVDRSTTVRFAPDLGNLSAYEWAEGAPVLNYVFVAGQGEGAARLIVERQDPASIARFGRIEYFRDARDVATAGELEQRGDESIANNASTSELRITPVDTDLVSYGRDYVLGDTVTVTVDGVDVADQVKQVTIRLSGDGEELAWAGALTTLPAAASNRQLQSRLSQLERV